MNLDMQASPEVAKQTTQSEETTPAGEVDYYKSDKLATLGLLTIVMLAMVAGLLILVFYLYVIQSPPPEFFRTSDRGELIPQVPLDKPNMETNQLLNWVAENMMSDNTFNFVNYQKVLERARPDYTDEGFDSFLAALKDAKIIDTVITNKYIMRASPLAAPQITKEGVLANHYLWKIKMPMRYQFRSVTTGGYEDYDITLLIMRVPTVQNPYGIKILLFSMANRRTMPNEASS